MKKLNNRGFTILELLIATMIFSVILLLLAFGLVKIGKTYYAGITASRTQEVAREISDDVVQSVQYGSDNFNPSPMPAPDLANPQSVKIGNHKYDYFIGHFLTGSSPGTGLRVTSLAPDHITATSTPKELLSNRMWLSQFKVVQVGAVYQITVKVVSGEQDLVEDSAHRAYGALNFDINTVRCKAGAGSQFCAVSGLYTEATKRV